MTAPPAALADRAAALSRARPPRRRREPGLPRVPRRAHGRGSRPSGADADSTLRASRPLSLPQDGRRVRLHLPVGRPPLAARQRPQRRLHHPGPVAHFSGPSGTGKTHLAIAIAYRAIQNGFDALFTTATALIEDLSAATRAGKLRPVLPTYTHPAVLVIDEVGYLGYGPDAANVLFQVVNDRYLHQRPMIFTTNKPLAAWGRVLHDADLAEAILDRVLERGRHLELRGRSYRTRHAPLDLTPASEPPSPGPATILRKRAATRSLEHPATGRSSPTRRDAACGTGRVARG